MNISPAGASVNCSDLRAIPNSCCNRADARDISGTRPSGESGVLDIVQSESGFQIGGGGARKRPCARSVKNIT